MLNFAVKSSSAVVNPKSETISKIKCSKFQTSKIQSALAKAFCFGTLGFWSLEFVSARPGATWWIHAEVVIIRVDACSIEINLCTSGLGQGYGYSSFGFFADLWSHRFEVKLRYFLGTIESFTQGQIEPILVGLWASASSHRIDHPSP